MSNGRKSIGSVDIRDTHIAIDICSVTLFASGWEKLKNGVYRHLKTARLVFTNQKGEEIIGDLVENNHLEVKHLQGAECTGRKVIFCSE